MRSIDHSAIYDYGVPGIVLMENAGREAARCILQHYSLVSQAGVSVFCGPGNNGGDGFVIARYLYNAGVSVAVYLLAPKMAYQGDAAIHLKILQHLPVSLEEITDNSTWECHRARALSRGILVDAIFGTGLRSSIEGFRRQVIVDMNSQGKAVVAIDIPSGIHASDGSVLGTAIRAETTVTFALPKVGMMVDPGFLYVGRVEVVDIGIPADLLKQQPRQPFLLDTAYVRSVLPSRPSTAHKGTFGHLLVVAGSRGKAGAAALAAQAALRSGAGLVTLAVPKSVTSGSHQFPAEVMVEDIPETPAGTFGVISLPRVEELLDGKTAVAVGPGMSLNPDVCQFVEALIARVRLPAVIDADALNALVGNLDLLSYQQNRVITPHPGEAARLLSRSSGEVQAARIEAVKELHACTGVTALLKGARSIVAGVDDFLAVNPTGNSGMSTAGSGDVLTGIVGSFLAQGMAGPTAAAAGAFVHGRAGDLARGGGKGRELIAGDIVLNLGAAFREIEGERIARES